MAKKFKFATVNFAHMFVTFSDAETPIEHTNAEMKLQRGIDTDCTCIRVNGFRTIEEMFSYCRDRNLIVV